MLQSNLTSFDPSWANTLGKSRFEYVQKKWPWKTVILTWTRESRENQNWYFCILLWPFPQWVQKENDREKPWKTVILTWTHHILTWTHRENRENQNWYFLWPFLQYDDWNRLTPIVARFWFRKRWFLILVRCHVPTKPTFPSSSCWIGLG